MLGKTLGSVCSDGPDGTCVCLTLCFNGLSALLRCCRGVIGAASGAGIAIGAYFAFYGAATNVLVNRTQMKTGEVAFCAGAIAAAGGSVVKVPLAVCIRQALC